MGFCGLRSVVLLLALEGALRRQWRDEVERPARSAGLTAPKLVISASPYRSFVGRLVKQVAEIEEQYPERPLAVVIPRVVEEHWWDYLLLNNLRTWRLCTALMRHGGPNLAVIIVPWAYEPPHPEKVIAERSHKRNRPQALQRSPFKASYLGLRAAAERATDRAGRH